MPRVREQVFRGTLFYLLSGVFYLVLVFRGTLIALGVLASAAMPATSLAQTPEPQTTLPDIEDEVMCTVCGTTLELASEPRQANDLRDQIRGLIGEGLTKDEIKDELVAEFGDEILATPSTEGFDLAAWVVPGAAVAAGAGVAFVGLRRWRGARPSPGDGNAPREEPLNAEDRERLDEDLERYDL
jgi:cytochrome c-type biogenesis protein CcmH